MGSPLHQSFVWHFWGSYTVVLKPWDHAGWHVLEALAELSRVNDQGKMDCSWQNSKLIACTVLSKLSTFEINILQPLFTIITCLISESMLLTQNNKTNITSVLRSDALIHLLCVHFTDWREITLLNKPYINYFQSSCLCCLLEKVRSASSIHFPPRPPWIHLWLLKTNPHDLEIIASLAQNKINGNRTNPSTENL